MGIFKPCYSVSAESVEYAVLALYDEVAARTTGPGFNDLLGEPILVDSDADGLGERTRPEVEVTLKCKVDFARNEEHRQDQVGNAGSSMITLTLYEAELRDAGLLVAGVPGIRPTDRLLRIESASGVVRFDFEANGRDGVHCFEVRPGETGTGIFSVLFEKHRPVVR